MRWSAIVCLVVALGSGPAMHAHAQSNDPDVQALIEQGRQHSIQGDKLAALAKARDALDLAIRKHGKESLEAADAETNLCFVGSEQLDAGIILEHLQHVLAVRQKLLPPNSLQIADALTNIALKWAFDGVQAQRAIPLLQQSLEIHRQASATETTGYETALGLLASAYRSSHQRQLAMETYQQMAVIGERRHGGQSSQVAHALYSMGTMKWEGGDVAGAGVLWARYEAITQATRLPKDEWYEADTTAFQRVLEGRYPEAEAILRRALASAKARTAPAAQVERAKLLLVEVLTATRRFAEAETLLLDVLKGSVGNKATDRTQYIRTLLAALKFYEAQARYVEADRIVSMIDKAYGRTGLMPAEFETGPIIAYFVKQSRFLEALGWSKRAIEPIRNRYPLRSSTSGDDWLEEQRAAKGLMFRHLGVIKAGWVHTFQTRPDLVLDDGFQTGQLAKGSDVGQSIAKMAARKAQQGDAFASGLRALQDGHAALATDEATLLRLISMPEAARGGASVDARLAEHNQKKLALQEIERSLAGRFPKYASLVSQAPLPLAEASSLLRPDEALLVYAIDIGSSYAWVVRHDKAFFAPSTAGQRFFDDRVRELRAKLTSGETGWAPQAMAPGDGIALYNAMLVTVESSGILAGAKHVFVVADGALQSLPFGVLPDGNGANPDWLAKRYAFSYLPSVAALRAVRKAGMDAVASEPFVGFGDPVLGDADVASTLSPRSIFGGSTRATGGLADVAVLRGAPALPETADELRAVASVLGAPATAILLRQQATESAVKAMDLSRYRVISFATHGVMAGELTPDSEPGLILTPPEQASAADDGYLGASEVAALRLNADWVLLSACNTAAPNGNPGAEGFSGLANAFLYAGAKALLVSHWRVNSGATTDLVSRALSKYAADQKASKAVALQRAMVELMAKPGYAHPYYWAAFSIVGD